MDAWPTPPEGAAPWPERIPEPSFRREPPAVDVPDGLYFNTHPSGRLRLLAEVKRGLLAQWLLLLEHGPAGCYKAEGSPWSAQRFHEDGRLEDFARDDDTSKPYPAGQTFAAWAHRQQARFGAPPAPMPDWLAQNVRLYQEMKAGDRPPARADRILSGDPPADLEERLPPFGGLSWHSPSQCHERLLHYFKWEPEVARDFTNFATAACAWVIRDPKNRPDTFLWTDWNCVREQALDDVPMFTRVRDAGLAEGGAVGGFRHWARCLGECCEAPASLTARLPSPIVWTLPPSGLEDFEVTRTVIELLLRQEASRRRVLGTYLETVDSKRFFAVASRAGAFLQSTAEPPENLAAWLESPPLESFGARAHREAGGKGKPAAPLGLGRFVNDRSLAIRECVAALTGGELYWRGYGQFEEWSEQDRSGHRRFRARAERYLEQSGLDLGAERNRFLLRVEVAGRRLVEGRWKARGVEKESLQDLERVLPGAGSAEYERWAAAATWALPRRGRQGPGPGHAVGAVTWPIEKQVS